MAFVRGMKRTAVAVALVASAGGAGAATVVNLEGAGSAFSVECSVFCEGWSFDQLVGGPPGPPTRRGNQPATFGVGSLAAGTWGDRAVGKAAGQGGQPNEDNIRSLFNQAGAGLATEPRATETLKKLEGGKDYSGISTFVLNGSAEYFWVFDAGFLYLFRTFNDHRPTPERQEFTFVKEAGGAPSNVGASGHVAPVPLPAAGWLFLSALAGLGGLAWRRKRTA